MKNTSLDIKYFIDSKTWYSYTMLIISVLSVITASFTMVIICKKKILLERKCNIFLFALLATHVSIGFVSTLIFSLEFFYGVSAHNNGNLDQEYAMLILHFLYMTAFAMVNLVTLDRLLAVKFPFYYERCSEKFCLYAIIIGLIPPVVFLLMQVIGDIFYAYSIFVLVGLVLSIFIGITNIIVYKEVKRQLQQIARTTVAENQHEKQNKLNCLNKRKWKSASNCALIVLTTILFLLPIEIVTILILIFRNCFFSEATTHVTYAAGMFVLLNSLKDPLLYIFLNKDVKQEMIKIFRRIIFSRFTYRVNRDISVEL